MQQSATPPRKGLSFIKKRDIILIAVLLVAAGVLFAVLRQKPPGTVARVTIAQSGGEDLVFDIPLNKDGFYQYDEGLLPVTLEVKDGRIRFGTSVCPDHLCEGFGWLQNEGDWAACVPAGVWVRIVTVEG